MNRWLRQSWLVLVLAASLGTALAVVEQSLQARIEQHARDRLSRAVLEVVPGGVRSTEAAASGRPTFDVFDDAGTLCGRAFVAETAGFSDRVRVMVGVSPDSTTLLGVTILESRETPGLGERIREAAFLQQFAGRPATVALQVVKPGQSAEQPIDAISGATISSNAVTRAVNECLADVTSTPDTQTGDAQ